MERIFVKSRLLVALIACALGAQLLVPLQTGSAVPIGSASIDEHFNSVPEVTFDSHYFLDSIDVSDMNGDGANDLLFGGALIQDGGVEIHLQTVPGSYSAAPDMLMSLAPGNTHYLPSTEVAAVECTGDGLMDLAVVGWWDTFYRGAIYAQSGELAFSFVNDLQPWNPHQIKTADMNGDGLTDLTVTENDYVSIFLQHEKTGFDIMPDQIICPHEPWPGYYLYDHTCADLNSDGRTDVVMSYEERVGDPEAGTTTTLGYAVAVFYQPANGWPYSDLIEPLPETQPDLILAELPADTPLYFGGLGIGDMNGDGHDDVVTVEGNYYTSGVVRIFPYSQQSGGISSTASQTFTVAPLVGFHTLPDRMADLNHDGLDDLLSSYPVSIYYQGADGLISTTPGFQTDVRAGVGIMVADLNSDGQDDILAADATRVSIWFDGGVAPPPPGEGWGTRQLIESNQSGDAWPPQIAMDPYGDGIAVWNQFDGVWSHIWACRYTTAGGWQEPELIESNDYSVAIYPAIDMDDSGNAICVWAEGVLGHGIWSNRYVRGTGWGTPAPIDLVGAGHIPKIGIDALGNAIAVWKQSGDIWYNRYVNGVGWGTAGPVETNPTDDWSPELAVDRFGNAIVAWNTEDSIPRSVWASRYVPGVGWGTPHAVQSSVGDSVWKDVAVDGQGNAFVVWHQYTILNSYTVVRAFAARYDSAEGWQTAVTIDDGSIGSSGIPRIAMDTSGNALALFSEPVPAGPTYQDTMFANRYTAGAGWGAPQRIDPLMGYIESVDIGIDSAGNALATWSMFDGTYLNLRSAYMTADGNWGEALFVEDSPGNCTFPPGRRVSSSGFDAEGNAIVVWRQFDGLRFSVYANRFVVQQEPPGPETVQADVDIQPDALNPSRAGKYLTAYISLPDGYDVRDIVLDSIRLNGRFPTTGIWEIRDFDKDGSKDLMVKFDWRKIARIGEVEIPEMIAFEVSGSLVNGTLFAGMDSVTLVPNHELDLGTSSLAGVRGTALLMTAFIALISGCGTYVVARRIARR